MTLKASDSHNLKERVGCRAKITALGTYVPPKF
jgi:hypothetical protein